MKIIKSLFCTTPGHVLEAVRAVNLRLTQQLSQRTRIKGYGKWPAQVKRKGWNRCCLTETLHGIKGMCMILDTHLYKTSNHHANGIIEREDRNVSGFILYSEHKVCMAGYFAQALSTD